MAADVFETRLEKVRGELHGLYMGLYNDEHAFDYFLSMLREYFDGRRAVLRELDAQREKDPGWFRDRDMLGMLMYTQCFAGTLKGVKDKLDYLQETGVNYVHLMPLLESPKGKSDGGYAVADYRKIQPELGDMSDLVELADECHRRDMSLCIDFVMNHTSEEHEWAKRAKTGEIEYQQRYFFYDNWDIPNVYEKTVPQVFPTTAPGNFTWCPEVSKVVMTMFYPYQWDLNYANPTVFNDMTANMLYLCNQGVDVIRLDAVPYIWKALYTNCRNLPQVHVLVRIMRLACEIVCPGVLLLGEVVMEPDKVVPYFGSVDRPECHMLYNVTTMASTWHTVATGDVRLLRHQLDTVFSLPKQYTFLNYLRCHDDIGWGLDYDFLSQFGVKEVPHKKYLNDWFRGGYYSEARGELYNDDPRLGDARLCGTTASLCGMNSGSEKSLRLDITLHAFLMSQSGLPILYSGDETGQLNDDSYHSDPLKADDSRYLHRGAMDWEAAERRNEPGTREEAIYSALSKLRKLRAEHRAFSAEADAWTWDTQNKQLLALGRYYEGEKLLAFFNFSSDPQDYFVCRGEEYTDLITGERYRDCGFTIPGYGFKWLVTEM